VRNPIGTPSKPVNEASQDLSPSRLRSSKILLGRQAEDLKPLLQLSPLLGFRLTLAEPKRATYDIDKWQERRLLAIRCTTAGQHKTGLPGALADKFVDQPRFSNSWLARAT
jgi:hypothetical protein